jgi:hypothetical protein
VDQGDAEDQRTGREGEAAQGGEPGELARLGATEPDRRREEARRLSGM